MSRGHEQYHPLLDDDDQEFISYDDRDIEQNYHRRRKIRHEFHLSELVNQIINLMYSSMHVYIKMIQNMLKVFCVSANIHILPSS